MQKFMLRVFLCRLEMLRNIMGDRTYLLETDGEVVVVYVSTNDFMWDDGNNLGPVEIHNYLNRVMYGRRNKFDPLWNSLVLGGVKNGQKYLGVVCFVLFLERWL